MVVTNHRFQASPSLPFSPQALDRPEEKRVTEQKQKRKRKTAEDYRSLAAEHGFEWIGKILPRNTLYPTEWKCLRNGHIWVTRYSRIQEGRQCPYCTEQWRKTEEDYHSLADQHGIYWIGKTLPANVRTSTVWQMPDGLVFAATYHQIQFRRRRAADRPSIALRKEVPSGDTEV